MKLFDFSHYAKRRDERRAAERVQTLKERLDEPGTLPEFKEEVSNWLTLHKEISVKAS
jgi:hypothetical protein